MAVEISELVAAVATVVAAGEINVLERDPLTACIDTPDGPIGLQVFTSSPTGTSVVELFMPVVKVSTTAPIDGWIARATYRLFNVHVGVRDLEGVSVVEARSSIVADGLTVEVLDRCLALLVIQARTVAGELNDLLGAAASAPCTGGLAGADQSRQTPPAPTASPSPSLSATTGGHVLTAGYL